MRQLLAAVLAVGFFSVSPMASAQTAPDCHVIASVPFDISAPGNYCLKDNMSTDLIGGAININSSNVTLDCRGRSITHTVATNEATAIGGGGFGPVADVVVRSCKIINFATGIHFSPGSEHIEILNNDILQSAIDGIVLWGSHSRITGNHVVNANDRIGLGFVRNITVTAFEPGIRSTGNVISNNMVTGAHGANGMWGIRVDMTQDVTINNNHITDMKPNEGGFSYAIAADATGSSRIVSNVMMSRIGSNMGIAAGGALCTRNIAVGLVTAGYEWCNRSVNNTIVP